MGEEGGTMRLSPDENKAIVRRFWEVYWNEADIKVADELLSPEYAIREKPWHEIAHSVFSDLKFTIDDLLCDGDKVVSIIRWQGTHRGEFNGIAPTQQVINGNGIWVHQIEDGRIQEEHWEAVDALGMGQQFTLIMSGAAIGKVSNAWAHDS